MYGEPGGVRTPDPALRRRVLYPTELLIHRTYTIITQNINKVKTKMQKNNKSVNKKTYKPREDLRLCENYVKNIYNKNKK